MSDPVSSNHPRTGGISYNYFSTPNSLLSRTIQVSKNTFMALLHHLYPTIITASAIPIAIVSGNSFLLALPVMWVVYNVFKGIQLLKRQAEIPLYRAALESLKSIRTDFAQQKFEEKINNSERIEELRENFNLYKTRVEEYKKSISSISSLTYCGVFKDFYTSFDLTNCTDWDVFISQKENIIELGIQGVDKELNNSIHQLPSYIKSLEKMFYAM
jgi:hypothetical protein